MASSVDAKLLKTTKFPVEFNTKVDMQKVNVEVLKKWIAGKISEILGNEDDVVIELCFNLIEGVRFPDIKKLQIQLTGFLDKDTASFCKELWKLCLSAQSNPQGVPKELLEAKKLELIQEKIEADKVAEDTRRRRDDEQRRDRDINTIRTRERGERGRGGGRGGDSWRGGRGDDRRDFDRGGGRGFDRRGPRSPPRRRDSRERAPFRPRESDTYVPSGRGAGRRRDDRRRSPSPDSKSLDSARSKSESRSPPPRRRNRSSSRSRSLSPRRRRSRSPDRRSGFRGRGGRGRGRSTDRGTRGRSPSRSDSSMSRSPRPAKRRRSISESVSASPPPRSRRFHRRESSSRSRFRSSRSLSRTPLRRTSRSGERARASITPQDDIDVTETHTGARRGHHRDERRLTRSNSRSITPPRHRRRSNSRGGRDRKRRRSMQRYEPNKRRRNTSSVSSPVATKDTKADTEDDIVRISPERESEVSHQTTESNEIRDPQKEASELRERLLREKIKKMRKSSIESVDAQANAR